MNWNPALPVLAQSRRTPHALALSADGVQLDYAQLVSRVRRLACVLRTHGIVPGRRVGILGSRSLVAVTSVLGVNWAGAVYVPLGVKWPVSRIETVLAQDRFDAIIVDRSGLDVATDALCAATGLLILPDDASAEALARSRSRLVLSHASLPESDALPEPAPMAAGDLVYVIFTSGTTGVPKGVMAPAGAVAAYLAALGERKRLTPADRASQFTELTFDPSMGEIFLPWYSGASLHVLPSVGQMSPARFIREQRLTVWGSAPAAIAWMRDTRSLQPGSLPTLRYSSFGGEPLPLASVRAWQAAAPDSVVDNLYGPTEATVDCVGQRVEPGATPLVTPERGILAIGTPHPGTELAILGPDLAALPDGVAGELAIAGAQLTAGYLGAPDLTRQRFPILDGKRWYLTGDRAFRDPAGQYHHLGRIDHQIKIHGHRVELEDIEAHLRAVSDSDQVAAVAWPVADGVALGIVGFVAGSPLSARQIREALRARLPTHMLPSAIELIAALPLNAHRKLDRRALVARLEAADGRQDA